MLLLLVSPLVPARAEPYAENVAKAEAYLLSHLNPALGLVYESEDTGQHWLRHEFSDFHWRYNQTYWLCSDNLFVYLALEPDHSKISRQIHASIDAYSQPAANFFEVVAGERIRLPLHDAEDYIVARNDNYAVMVRLHNSTRPALGNYVDFWMYEALEYALEGKLDNAAYLVRRAEGLWRGNGLWDWSFTFHDHMFSNQKLALLLFTARAIGLRLSRQDEMEEHLWSMQNVDGGVTSLSDKTGRKAGSANAETTALSILIYDQTLLSRFPKIQPVESESESVLIQSALFVASAILIFVTLLYRRRSRLGPRVECINIGCHPRIVDQR